MSLINQMLRDLDARHASDAGGVLPQQVRPLAAAEQGAQPMQRQRQLAWIMLLVLGMLGLILGIKLWPMLAANSAHPAVSNAPASVKASGAGMVQPEAEADSAPGSASETETLESELLAALPSLLDVQRNAAAAASSGADANTGLRLDQTLTLSQTWQMPPASPIPPASNIGNADKDRSSPAQTKPQPQPQPQPQRQPRAMEDAPAENEDAGASTPQSQPQPQAAARIEKVDRSEPGSDVLRAATTLYQQGRVKEAISRLQQGLQTMPQQASLRHALLSIHLEQKQLAAALELLQQGLALSPGRVDWAMTAARIQVERGQLQAAWQTLQQHQASAGQNAEYQGFAAVLLQHLQQPHEAAAYYRAALRLKPREARWWYALGSVLEADGQTVQAREAYQRAQAIGGLPASMAQTLESKLKPGAE